MKNLKAFTMIELVFVIVVLGILAGIAVPRLAATRDDATIAKMRGDIAAIRSGLSLVRSENMMRGVTTWPALEGSDNATLFDGVLQQPIYPTKASIPTSGANKDRNVGSFDCNHQEPLCQSLAQ